MLVKGATGRVVSVLTNMSQKLFRTITSKTYKRLKLSMTYEPQQAILLTWINFNPRMDK